jgi:YD repeat-containing protein
VQIVDELGRTWTADYCDPIAPNTGIACSLITSYTATDTDGAASRVIKDGYGNILKITKNPKPGSTGLAPIVTEAAYAISNIKTQNKPLWVKDGKGFQADYSYDAAHGGVLSEMKPAPSAGAARPLKLTTWTQKFAYIKNASGSLVAAANAEWVIAAETDCQTVAGSSSPVCDAAAPQRVTTYEYGADGTANNLWIRGISVTADGVTRRTCFGYDGLGRKISTTTPNANLTSCP